MLVTRSPFLKKLVLEKRNLQELSATDIIPILTAEQLEQALAHARGQELALVGS